MVWMEEWRKGLRHGLPAIISQHVVHSVPTEETEYTQHTVSRKECQVDIRRNAQLTPRGLSLQDLHFTARCARPRLRHRYDGQRTHAGLKAKTDSSRISLPRGRPAEAPQLTDRAEVI